MQRLTRPFVASSTRLALFEAQEALRKRACKFQANVGLADQNGLRKRLFDAPTAVKSLDETS
jgi:hypothetical protein